MISAQSVLTLLLAYSDIDMRDRFIRFIQQNPDSFTDRANPVGHCTASAWIVDQSREHALLVHHAKFDKWVQPGGHLETTDESLLWAVEREIREETGLVEFRLASPTIYDLAIHDVAARGDMPAHHHYDIRFLFVAPMNLSHADDPTEILGTRWMSNEAIKNDPDFDPTVCQLAEKACVNPV